MALLLVAALLATANVSSSRPNIHNWPIPFGPRRKHEMAAYCARHYGERTWRLRLPRVLGNRRQMHAPCASPAGCDAGSTSVCAT